MIAGWDDAPLVDVPKSVFPKSVTLAMPYFENPLFLAKQIYGWSRLPKELKPYLSVIVVDDCSPDNPAEKVVRASTSYKPPAIRVFRIDTKVRWNWLAARNIAMAHATDGWCVGTDMDHVIPIETAEALVWGAHDSERIYRFSRAEHTGEVIHSHPNSWLMTRAMFWKFGGYDENISGLYGSDGEARRRWVKTAPVLTLKDRLIRWERYGDASTTHYGRKEAVDLEVQRIVKARGKDWAPKVLSFPFHEVTL